MNIVKMSIHNYREGILTKNEKFFTCISDQCISDGDIILHPQYSKVIDGNVATMVVDQVVEERPSKGEWKNNKPSTFRNCSYKREVIPGKVMSELGYLRQETVYDESSKKNIKKTFIVF
jgi:hypothetical protein